MSLTDSLDMSLFFGTPEQKTKFCDSLLDVLKKRGVAKIKNHGIPDEMIHELFAQTRTFFNLNLKKMTAKHPPEANPNRGYSFVGQENVANIRDYEKGKAEGLMTKDIKETFDMGVPSDHLVDNDRVGEDVLPGFRAFMEYIYEQAFNTELIILSALAKALGPGEDELRSLHTKAENEFRLLPTLRSPPRALRTVPRCALPSAPTLVPSPCCSRTRRAACRSKTRPTWAPSTTSSQGSKTDIMLNIDDSLQRLTNETFKAACHRVTYPPTVKLDDEEVVIPERFSVALFCEAGRGTRVCCC